VVDRTAIVTNTHAKEGRIKARERKGTVQHE